MIKIAGLIAFGFLLSIATTQVLISSTNEVDSPALNNPPLPPVLILEDTFKDEDWEVTAEANLGATYSVTQRLTGGFGSPPFRFMSHRLPPVTGNELSTLAVTHVYLGASYDPSVQGAILEIDYSESGIILSFPFPEAFSTSRPVVTQNGRIYRADRVLSFIAVNSTHDWEAKSLRQLREVNFVAIDGSEDHPDFSASGGTLHFGFTRTNTRGSTLPPVPSDQDLVIDQGIDHLQFSIYRQQEEEVNHPPQAQDDIFVLDGYKRSLPLFEIFDVVHGDYDPDNDSLEVIDITEPTFGTAGPLSTHTIVYQLEKPRINDSFRYSISDGELSSTAKVEVYIDCACTVTCLNQLELPGQAASQATDAIDLPLIYRVRDDVMRPTADGRRYIEMYYRQNPEILVNILTNELLRAEALHTVELWQEPLRNLTAGDGAVRISQDQVDALEDFLNHLADASSLELQGVIAAELQRLGPLDTYVGLTVKEAKKQAIGDAMLQLPYIRGYQ